MMALILLIIAPALQIILSSLRIRNKISTPIAIIILFTIAIGLVFLFIEQVIISNDAPTGEARGMLSIAYLFVGALAIITSALIIAIISGIMYYSKNKKSNN
ncbi:MAG TPA: hypothetical protein VL442_08750 [Mucilaginibacter sp.]|jgi:hypothetical protein|nr:hypothetical protein [Mucilaginibacter sp.]